MITLKLTIDPSQGIVLIWWMTSLHVTFSRLNSGENQSFILWMRLSREIPAEDFRVVGLCEKENTAFWTAADQFNVQFNRALNVIILFTFLMLNAQIFLIRYEIDLATYLLVQTLHSVHHYLFLYAFFHIVTTMNVFYLTILAFFNTKFRSIGRRISKLERMSPINNRDLHRLIFEFNRVFLESMKINDYFKLLFGHNLVGFFAMTVICSFVLLYIELRLKFLYSVIVLMYIIIFGFPFQFASSVLAQVFLLFESS